MYIYLYVDAHVRPCICIYMYIRVGINVLIMYIHMCVCTKVSMQAYGCAIQLDDGLITLVFNGNYDSELTNGGV